MNYVELLGASTKQKGFFYENETDEVIVYRLEFLCFLAMLDFNLIGRKRLSLGE